MDDHRKGQSRRDMTLQQKVQFRWDVPFTEALSLTRGKVGRFALDDDDLLLLACEEISHTTTYEEKNYTTGSACTESS